MTPQLTPARTEVELDTYALVIHQGGQDLYQYEKPTPWEDPEWIEKRQYSHEDVPPLNLENTQVEQHTNGGDLQGVTLYASKLDADEEATTTSSTGHETEKKSYRGYVIRFSDGQVIPGEDETIHTTQENNMGAAIDHLIQEYDLIEELDLPYLPSWARQNCSINTEPTHPDGSDMRGAYELTGGYYLYTSLNKQSKIDRIKDLADKVDVESELLGDW